MAGDVERRCLLILSLVEQNDRERIGFRLPSEVTPLCSMPSQTLSLTLHEGASHTLEVEFSSIALRPCGSDSPEREQERPRYPRLAIGTPTCSMMLMTGHPGMQIETKAGFAPPSWPPQACRKLHSMRLSLGPCFPSSAHICPE